MATTLEDFVAKLHADGVASGRAEADRLIEEAHREAESIRLEAEARAREIVARAGSEAAASRERAEAELGLAVRDALLGLRAVLTRCMQAVVSRALEPRLRDDAVLTELLAILVREYARADGSGERHIRVRVPQDVVARLDVWALQELGRAAASPGIGVDVEGGLADAGFEYRIAGTKVDMSMEAVVEQVRELVRPGLWRLLDDAAHATGAMTPVEHAAPAGRG